jgi:hypothetical protein
MDLASVVAHHLIRLQQPIEIYTSMLLKTIAHNPLVRSSTLRGGTNQINGLKHYEAELFSAFLFCVPVPRPRL